MIAVTDASHDLARWVAELSYAALPAEAVEMARRCLLDHVGCMLAGASVPWTRPVLAHARASSGPPESTVVGQAERLPAGSAALVNATFGQGCELDDYTVRGWGGGHCGAGTIPTALALGEREHATGRDVLLAIVAGYEVMDRLGRVIRPTVDRRGFHMHGLLAPFGSAAVAARLLRLDAAQTQTAFAIALSYCGGTTEYDQSGGEVKRLHAGRAARAGVEAAELARLGLTGPAAPFEGKRGLFKTFASGEIAAPLSLPGNSAPLAILETCFKLHACVATCQAAIDALADVMESHSCSPEQVRRLVVGVAPTTVDHGGAIVEPTDVASAQFSLPFSLALRLVRRANHLEDYLAPALWRDPTLLRLARLVEVYGDAEARGNQRHGARLRVELADGTVLERYRPYPRGSALAPVGQAELDEKFFRLARRAVSAGQAERLRELVQRFDRLEDIGQLTAWLGRPIG